MLLKTSTLSFRGYRKHCEEKKKCCLPELLPFPTQWFLKALSSEVSEFITLWKRENQNHKQYDYKNNDEIGDD